MFDTIVVMRCAVGSNNRYDSGRRATGREAAEARALHTMGELVSSQPGLVLDSSSMGQLAEVLHATAIELDAVRSVLAGIRRAVLGLANALRVTMDPRAGGGPPGDVPGAAVSRSGRPGCR